MNRIDSDNPVALRELANELGYNPSSIRKAAARRGFSPFTLIARKNQPLYLSKADADLFRNMIKGEKTHKIFEVKKDFSKVSGVYFIEVPSYSEVIRVKIGWSENIYDRISTYRTIIPDLRVKSVWETTDQWFERMALKFAGNNGRRVFQELFEFDDTQYVLDELTLIFNKLGVSVKGGEFAG